MLYVWSDISNEYSTNPSSFNKCLLNFASCALKYIFNTLFIIPKYSLPYVSYFTETIGKPSEGNWQIIIKSEKNLVLSASTVAFLSSRGRRRNSNKHITLRPQCPQDHEINIIHRSVKSHNGGNEERTTTKSWPRSRSLKYMYIDVPPHKFPEG